LVKEKSQTNIDDLSRFAYICTNRYSYQGFDIDSVRIDNKWICFLKLKLPLLLDNDNVVVQKFPQLPEGLKFTNMNNPKMIEHLIAKKGENFLSHLKLYPISKRYYSDPMIKIKNKFNECAIKSLGESQLVEEISEDSKKNQSGIDFLKLLTHKFYEIQKGCVNPKGWIVLTKDETIIFDEESEARSWIFDNQSDPNFMYLCQSLQNEECEEILNVN